ncbi:P-loop containing nucleoside triphosphate hydrolase protein, partial [Rozella allomycis CSF55]
ISSPRDYQRKLFTYSLNNNSIVWLPTGSGKTLIALMLLKHYIVKDMKKKCFFLVPTVALGIQQFEYLNGNLPCKVSFVYGGRNVDQWSRETWYTEIEEHQCFVMTPQLFLDGHRHALIDKSLISVVVFDECHHAVKGHPYKLIMNELQENLANIRILGLSASP